MSLIKEVLSTPEKRVLQLRPSNVHFLILSGANRRFFNAQQMTTPCCVLFDLVCLLSVTCHLRIFDAPGFVLCPAFMDLMLARYLHEMCASVGCVLSVNSRCVALGAWWLSWCCCCLTVCLRPTSPYVFRDVHSGFMFVASPLFSRIAFHVEIKLLICSSFCVLI